MNETSVMTQRANVTPDVLELATGFGILHRFRESKVYSFAARALPLNVRRFGARLAATKVNAKDVRTEDVIDFLRPIQRPQTEELSELLGREFDEWATLYGAGKRSN